MTFIVPILICVFQELAFCLHFKSKPVTPSSVLIPIPVSRFTDSGYDCDESELY